MVRALEVLAGSSPHKWGILAPANLPKELPRFIPTQVGNTILAITIPFSAGFIPTQVGNTGVVRVLLTLSSVHPHTSGEYFSRYLLTLSAPGSSPHKWGILKTYMAEVQRLRFIPTQVGNTAVKPEGSGASLVHPHTSGEYVSSIMYVCSDSGSSPHKWGIQHLSLVTLYVTRFIPTQVGNTYSCIVHVSPLPVHPHTSGEYVSNSSPGRRHCGSSPHKWGIRNSSLVLLKPLRFIPTQVGNTRSSRLMEDGSLGSSPHKWGIPDTGQYESVGSGSSPHKWGIHIEVRSRPYTSRSPVHPHTSGEYPTNSLIQHPHIGSSPHKWGIQ